MTFRERLADWISGGAVTRAKYYQARAAWFAHRLDEANERLDHIAAMETPRANATVRRMARIAREAMK